jgi:hypothetical protein
LYPALLSAISAGPEIAQQNKDLLVEKLNLALQDENVLEKTKSLILEWKSINLMIIQ